MNIYDFDKTIYDGDSTAAFIKYCAKRYRKAYITIIPTLWAFFLYMLGIYTKTRFKEKMYGFLKYIPDIDCAVSDFWDKHEENILQYYKKQHRPDDIIISASPQFLLEEICKRIGVKRLIASRVDKHTGKYSGENCWGAEKVRRLIDEYATDSCTEFYSDSKSDAPLAEIADRAYIVRRNTLTPWKEYKETTGERLKHMFLEPKFFVFIMVGGICTVSNVGFSAIYSMFIHNTTAAFIPGYVTSNIVGYILNSLLTFKDKKLSVLKFFKFFISYIPNFCIQTGIVWLYDRLIHGPGIIAYIAAALIGVPVTFVIMKIFTFK